MTIHVLDEPKLHALCTEEVEGDKAITLEEALDETDETYFDCVNCHKVLTDGNRHTPAPSEE